jgi:hypothetical protein
MAGSIPRVHRAQPLHFITRDEGRAAYFGALFPLFFGPPASYLLFFLCDNLPPVSLSCSIYHILLGWGSATALRLRLES